MLSFYDTGTDITAPKIFKKFFFKFDHITLKALSALHLKALSEKKLFFFKEFYFFRAKIFSAHGIFIKKIFLFFFRN
jgi:hypothetical protein